ncbi:uncharacterized protein [Argopecten irradians]
MQPSTLITRAEEVNLEGKTFSLDQLPLRDQGSFKPGRIHECMAEWEKISPTEEVRDWLQSGVDIHGFFRPFKGNFKGKAYNSPMPPSAYFENSPSCEKFSDFVVQSLTDRVKNGSLRVVGKVGECDPPHLVLPLTVEPSKPRLCHDERFLNQWIKDSPFQLDTLKDIPRLVERDTYMTSVDDKSGYDHVLLHENSQKYFGVQFGGWFFVYTTLPFGFKASAFIYQSIGMVATGYCRSLGVPILQYIDDRWIGEKLDQVKGHMERAACGVYMVCQVLTRLGYTLGLNKSTFIPTQFMEFLGMGVDSVRQAFILPEKKKQRFIELREEILRSVAVDVKSLQRFAGKCVSMVLAVPAAKLYTVEVNRSISVGLRSSRLVRIDEYLRQELLHWKFLDNWEGCMTWRSERHLQLVLATDASLYKWGAFLKLNG